MNRQELISQIQQKKSFLCIGLDVDLAKIPTHLLAKEDPIFEFNKQIIDATHHLAVAYKPNTAFYEAYGIKGWQALEKTINYINENYEELKSDYGLRYQLVYWKKKTNKQEIINIANNYIKKLKNI